jgi:acetoin utilization deacetylase AcuC-like enzyme
MRARPARRGYRTRVARGLYVHHPLSLAHDTGPHPENAARVRAIETALAARGWLGLERLEAPAASREQLERVHDPAHVERIRALCAAGGGMIDLDTVVSAESYEAGLRAAGGAADAALRLLRGEADFAFCALRPPGHHAEPAAAMGFCLFNNIAIAIEHARAVVGLERALVVDWDVHHGNGTAAIYAASDRVLYASIHQSPLYPGTGAATDFGVGQGLGWTVNLPVPPGTGPPLFLALVEHVVVPLVREVDPGLVAISAGYDAHRADPLAQCELDEPAYAAMAASVRAAAAEAEAPILVCLEGGYQLEALAASVVATIEGLGPGEPADPAPRGPAEPYLARVREHWPI